ncbi:hypothetical protein [Helicobacter marmotae]|uniref:Uncharacterized protein n=1 Tax=Helicobacter marmotae TaxID=152490 RepID=A0A3D8I7P7_9HELI|nr:hypothetical protein [Helicobacter marmotae]RDU61035.1 hypothetical protein CQA63_00575 [Helicobacter marmotae]
MKLHGGEVCNKEAPDAEGSKVKTSAPRRALGGLQNSLLQTKILNDKEAEVSLSENVCFARRGRS